MLIGEVKSTILPADENIVNPSTKAIEGQEGKLHHYVDLSKEGYFKQAWKKI